MIERGKVGATFSQSVLRLLFEHLRFFVQPTYGGLTHSEISASSVSFPKESPELCRLIPYCDTDYGRFGIQKNPAPLHHS